jgi:putative oxidoreductase
MFPAGWPGFALLLLRASVAVSTFLGSGGYGQHHAYWFVLVLLLLSAALCAGFLTPLAALVAFALQLSRFSHGGLGTAALLLDSLSLSMLGPGAYSVDAHRFGRRLVVIPPSE